MIRLLSCSLGLFAVIAANIASAQTGPAPEAAKLEVARQEIITPKALIDPKAAASIWKIKQKAAETTATFEKRVRTQLKELLNKDPKKLNYDSDYWRLLAYLREVPWDKMPESRRRWYLEKMPNPRLTDAQRVEMIKILQKKPIYKMTPKELDIYLAFMQEKEPDLRKRIVSYARQNLNQPYDIYLLGEFPHEVYDPDPMFCLEKGDCVVFSEHMYAMSLSANWKEFYQNLQRLRYKDGVPGMTTRNHYTEADWDKNNTWLVEDVTSKLGATTVTKYTERIDRASFFRNFGIGQEIKPEVLHDDYIPANAISSVLDKLEEGDFVNIVRGRGDGVWVGHVGLIGKGKDGTIHFIHSTEPKSKEQPIMEYVNDNVKKNVEREKKGQAMFMGMKFLKLRPEAQIEKAITKN